VTTDSEAPGAKARSGSLKLASMVAFSVQDAKDNDLLALNAVEKLVREPASKQTTESSIVNRPFGILPERRNRAADFLKEFVSQARPLRFIPELRFPQIRFRIRPDENTPTHLRVGFRSRSLTSSHDEPASGFR